ncbi:MAG: HAMP domain-containing protein [Acidobacteriota bacterium]
MNIQTRFLLGYGYLISLLVLSAAGAALGFQRLGNEIGRLLAENFEGARAAMLMMEALERQDSALLGQLLGKQGSAEVLAKSDQGFAAALELAWARIDLAEEMEIVSRIEDRMKKYRASREALLAGTYDRPLVEYDRETFPRFEQVKQQVLGLLNFNHEAMLAADRRAERSAYFRAVMHGLLVLLALISLGFLSRTLRRDLLDRLAELRAVAESIASGDRTRRATITRKDELGVVAAEFNSMLDRLWELEGTMEGRLGRQRQLLLGLLRSRDENAALISAGGDIVASSLASGDEGALQELIGELDAGRPVREMSRGNRTFRFQQLEADRGRAVGWLATVSPTPGTAPWPGRDAN